MRQYRAVCFDLDGTLLPMDIEVFMRDYFQAIGAFAARKGLDPELFLKALKAGTKAMAVHEDDKTNAEAFWEVMLGYVGGKAEDWEVLFNEFYEQDFSKIGMDYGKNPAMARALEVLAQKGYPLLLTTMPMFPPLAVQWRVAWSGVNPDLFTRVTTYSNSKSVKPKATYYAENLAAMGLRGEEVLMVGNNTLEDYAFSQLGADVYIVTNWLLGPADFDLNAVKHGTVDEFEAWVNALPICENPAQNIETGVISFEATERALAENAVVEIDREDAVRKAARILEDPAYRSGKE